MKITNIRVTPVSIPFNAPFHWSAGIYPGSSKSIIEVETDQGIVDWEKHRGGILVRLCAMNLRPV